MTHHLRNTLPAAFLLLAACTHGDEPGIRLARTVDPDSVLVVENGERPQDWTGSLPTLELEDEWVLGDDPAAEDALFGYLAGELLAEGPDQQVGVFLLRAFELRVFDRDGHLLWKAGREGEGPGEFHYPSSLVYVQGVGWVVSERSDHTVFDEVGRYVRTVHFAQLPFPGSRFFRLTPSGGFWYRGFQTVSLDGSMQDVVHVIAGSWDEQTGQEVFTWSRPPLRQEEKKIFMWEQWPDDLETDDRGRAWVLCDLSYTIEVLSTRPDERFRVRRDFEPTDYDPAYRKVFEANWELYTVGVPMMWPRLPTYQPALRGITRGPGEQMWAFQRAWVDSPLVQVDVFDAEGVYRRAFIGDFRLQGAVLGPDHVYWARDGADGAPLLVRSRYRFVRP